MAREQARDTDGGGLAIVSSATAISLARGKTGDAVVAVVAR
jgi:hypothetical protein